MKDNLIRNIVFQANDVLLPKITGERSWAHIGDLINSGQPFMAARLGAVESKAILYTEKKAMSLFLQKYVYVNMPRNAGFFPATESNLKKFGDMMTQDIQQIDVLFSWRPEEIFLRKYLRNAFKASFSDTNIHPEEEAFWTRYLAGKSILVIHPFSDTIESQYYNNRTKLFSRPNFIPEFKAFSTIKAVQSVAGNTAGFDCWFDALEFMKREIDKKDFDIALIGCGAYGLPLAAYVKRQGRQAIHLGGVLQLYFGIKGKRWDDWGLYNEFWVSPDKKEIPINADKVENGCYW